jgi:gliding motility-associated-like protein
MIRFINKVFTDTVKTAKHRIDENSTIRIEELNNVVIGGKSKSAKDWVDKISKSSVYGVNFYDAVRHIVKSSKGNLDNDIDSLRELIKGVMTNWASESDAEINKIAYVLRDEGIMADFKDITIEFGTSNTIFRNGITTALSTKPIFLQKLGFPVINMSFTDEDMKTRLGTVQDAWGEFKAHMASKGYFAFGKTGNATEPFFVKLPMIVEDGKMVIDKEAIASIAKDSLEYAYKDAGLTVPKNLDDTFSTSKGLNALLSDYVSSFITLSKTANSNENLKVLKDLNDAVNQRALDMESEIAGVKFSIETLQGELSSKWNDISNLLTRQEWTGIEVNSLNDTFLGLKGSMNGPYSIETIDDIRNGQEPTPAPAPQPVVIPNVMTPNGDNKNDLFIIKNLEQWENGSVTIMNRWGRVVYKNTNYKNDWDGSGVPDGVYFGVLEVTDGTTVKNYNFNLTIIDND